MINFDAVDFSERRSEEVISFFWHSVYDIVHGMAHFFLSFCVWCMLCDCRAVPFYSGIIGMADHGKMCTEDKSCAVNTVSVIFLQYQ